MGKYVRDAKMAGDVAVMEVSQSTVGVRTRAKTLALQRLQSSAPPPSPDSCYLQLRSRRLEKPPAVLPNNSKKLPKRNLKSGSKQSFLQDEESRTCRNSDAQSSSGLRGGSMNSGSVNHSMTGELYFQESNGGIEINDGNDFGILEASFGETILDCEPRDRFTRETTPCSLIREADDVKTPSSTTRRTNARSATHRMRSSVRNIPSTGEMDEFFGCAEQQQQALFIEKYNFDIVNDLPLPGRYEWATISQ
ncbi:PREDICTED: cyclin-dependent kinase inhibitor 3-like [Ipomoea nil]|uniref:cyclin-dependent kinase inhibitor 3-like n=1 Tax=Ipomoea nil TaxID=35883 RepID=UPI000901B32F|nr:PREDICTED: cyclin-dependent kinase inhibitor 3-like [Ipomoea nil]